MVKKYFYLVTQDITNHEPCPKCGSESQKLGEGRGPHVGCLKCGGCDRFIKWISKAQLIKIQNQGGQV